MFVEQLPEYPNFVVKVDWVCKGNLGCPSVYNTLKFNSPGDPFVEYKDLTEEQVLGWVWENVNKEQIESQANTPLPPPANNPTPLPWG
jgi:hypothetical protein